jgi:hypothetical protein
MMRLVIVVVAENVEDPLNIVELANVVFAAVNVVEANVVELANVKFSARFRKLCESFAFEPTTGTTPAREEVALKQIDRATIWAEVSPGEVEDASSAQVAISTIPLIAPVASAAPELATPITNCKSANVEVG